MQPPHTRYFFSYSKLSSERSFVKMFCDILNEIGADVMHKHSEFWEFLPAFPSWLLRIFTWNWRHVIQEWNSCLLTRWGQFKERARFKAPVGKTPVKFSQKSALQYFYMLDSVASGHFRISGTHRKLPRQEGIWPKFSKASSTVFVFSLFSSEWTFENFYLLVDIFKRNTLQHTATHCNTLQHTATHCNTLQHSQNVYLMVKILKRQLWSWLF